MAIKTKQLSTTDTITEIVEKLNFNFDQININGGGLRGFKGLPGLEGDSGPTGRSGAEIQTGTFPPLNNSSALQVIKDNILNLQIGDYYLYLGSDSFSDGYFLGDLYEIVESSGTIIGFDDFELQFKGNIRGPKGNDASSLGQTPSYISNDNERHTRRNPANTEFDIVGLPIPKKKPFMPVDTRFTTMNRDLFDANSEAYLISNPSNIMLMESYRQEISGTEGLSIDFIIEDLEYDELGLETVDILETRKATIRYSKDLQNDAYLLNIRNDYESDGAGAGFPSLTGNILIESSRQGNLDINYGRNFTIDINDDLLGDEGSFDGDLYIRSRRRSTFRNEESGSGAGSGYLRLEQYNNTINANSPSSELTLSDRLIYARTLAQSNPSQTITANPSPLSLRVDSLLFRESENSNYDFLPMIMQKGSFKNYNIIDTRTSSTWVVHKTSNNRGSQGIADAGTSDYWEDYYLAHNATTGDTYIKGGQNSTSGEIRNVEFAFGGDQLRIQRIAETSGGLSGNNSSRLPYIDIKNASGQRGLLLGYSAASSNGTANYVEIRPGANYDLFFNDTEHGGFKIGYDSNPLTQTQRYAYANGSLSISNTATNGVTRGLYLTETTSDMRGFNMVYNPANAEDLLYIRANNDGTNNINAISVRRSSANVGIKLADGNDANYDLTIGRSNVGIYENSNSLFIMQNASSAGAINVNTVGTVINRIDSNNNSTSEYFDIRKNGEDVVVRIPEYGTSSTSNSGIGSIHIPGTTNQTYVRGLTFGYNDNSNATAGLFAVSTSGNTNLELRTSNNNSTRNHRLQISGSGNLDISGNTIAISKSGNQSFLRFDSQSSDPGYIRHYELSNVALMDFVVSDDAASNDQYRWKGSDEANAMTLDTLGNLYIRNSISSPGTLSVGGTNNNQGRLIMNPNTGSPMINFMDYNDISWTVGADDNDNGFKIHGNTTGTVPVNIASLASPHFEITTAGEVIIRNNDLTLSHNIKRTNHNLGHLEGSYNNVAANGARTNPIYTIGSSYNPQVSTLNNMYGIGYAHSNEASFLSGFKSIAGSGTGWGLYVASDGDARIFLDGTTGRAHVRDVHLTPAGGGRLKNVRNIAFNWDTGSTSYENTPNLHGIESTNDAGGFSDNISINSYNSVIMRLDSNANGSSSEFRIRKDTSTNGGTTLFQVNNSGSAYASQGFSITNNVYLRRNGHKLRITSSSFTPYIDIGFNDNTYARLESDKRFYMNQRINVNGRIERHNGNTYMDSAIFRTQPTSSGGTAELRFDSNVNSGSDYGVLRWHDHNTSYSRNGTSGTEKGLLFLNTGNDGTGAAEDNIAIAASGDIWLNPDSNSGRVILGSRTNQIGYWDRNNGRFQTSEVNVTGTYKRNGTTVIDTSNAFIGSGGVNTSGNIIGNNVSFRGTLYNDNFDSSNIVINDNKQFVGSGGINTTGDVRCDYIWLDHMYSNSNSSRSVDLNYRLSGATSDTTVRLNAGFSGSPFWDNPTNTGSVLATCFDFLVNVNDDVRMRQTGTGEGETIFEVDSFDSAKFTSMDSTDGDFQVTYPERVWIAGWNSLEIESVTGNITLDCTLVKHNSSTVHGSDKRIKTNGKELETNTALSIIEQLDPKSYVKHGNYEFGFYAQDVQNIPEIKHAVSVEPGMHKRYGVEDFLYLNYQELHAVSIKTLKFLKAENEDKTKKIDELTNEVATLKSELELIKKHLGL